VVETNKIPLAKLVGGDNLQKKQTICCKERPIASQENKPTEGINEYHYMCPKCGANPVLVRITG
jgi:hypothetical protein